MLCFSGLIKFKSMLPCIRGAGDLFEVLSYVLFGSTADWPLLKVATAIFSRTNPTPDCGGMLVGTVRNYEGIGDYP